MVSLGQKLRRFTPEEDSKIEHLYNNGLRLFQIAAELSREPSSVKSRAIKLGLPGRYRGRLVPDEVKRLIRLRVVERLSYGEIAKRLNEDKDTIRGWIQGLVQSGKICRSVQRQVHCENMRKRKRANRV